MERGRGSQWLILILELGWGHLYKTDGYKVGEGCPGDKGLVAGRSWREQVLKELGPGQAVREEPQTHVDREWNHFRSSELGEFAARQALLSQWKPSRVKARVQWSRGRLNGGMRLEIQGGARSCRALQTILRFERLWVSRACFRCFPWESYEEGGRRITTAEASFFTKNSLVIRWLLTYQKPFLVTTEDKIGRLPKCVSRIIGQAFAFPRKAIV